jgi:hypothetical protein
MGIHFRSGIRTGGPSWPLGFEGLSRNAGQVLGKEQGGLMFGWVGFPDGRSGVYRLASVRLSGRNPHGQTSLSVAPGVEDQVAPGP